MLECGIHVAQPNFCLNRLSTKQRCTDRAMTLLPTWKATEPLVDLGTGHQNGHQTCTSKQENVVTEYA